jgi:hypothetical protein
LGATKRRGRCGGGPFVASRLPNLELTIWVMMVAIGLFTPPAPGTTSKTDDGVVVAMVVPALVVVVVTPPELVLAGNNELLKRRRLIRERGKKGICCPSCVHPFSGRMV